MRPENLLHKGLDLEQSALYNAHRFASRGFYYPENSEFFNTGLAKKAGLVVTFVDHGEAGQATFIDRLSDGIWTGFHIPRLSYGDLLLLTPRMYPNVHTMSEDKRAGYLGTYWNRPSIEELADIEMDLKYLANGTKRLTRIYRSLGKIIK